MEGVIEVVLHAGRDAVDVSLYTLLPIMVVMMLMTANPKVMGKFTLPWPLKVAGWIAIAVMAVASTGLFATLVGQIALR